MHALNQFRGKGSRIKVNGEGIKASGQRFKDIKDQDNIEM